MTKKTNSPKMEKSIKQNLNRKETKTLEEIQEKKHAEDKLKEEKSIENGTGITIVLSWDILVGWFLYRKQIAYKVNKEQFLLLEHHAKILGIAIRLS